MAVDEQNLETLKGRQWRERSVDGSHVGQFKTWQSLGARQRRQTRHIHPLLKAAVEHEFLSGNSFTIADVVDKVLMAAS